MRAFKVFIFGLLYGWVFKIAFDRIYRENDMEDLRNENASLRDYIHSLESKSTKSESVPSRSYMPEQTLFSPPAPQPKNLPNATLTQPAPAEPFDIPTQPDVSQPMEMPAPSLGASEGDRDDLKVIKGIGPAIERRFNNAGIYTFAALAALTRADLESILGNQVKRLQDENNLIAQAKKLARQR